MKKIGITIIPFAFFLIDRLLKFLLPTESSFFIFKKQIGILYTKNQGMAFSLNLPNCILIPLILIILSWLIYFNIKNLKNRKLNQFFYLNLIICGAFSNLIDRLFYGYVLDYIKIFSWPVFNLGDTMIVVGIGLWFFLTIVKLV